MSSKKLCGIYGCNFPEGECAELCWHPEEHRADIIASNGNDGLHYQHKGRVHIVVMEDGRITLDYLSNWLTGDGTEQLQRAKAMIDMVLRARGQE
jgi:hypothetical protein